jgi:predicted nuclease of predicted toxin-antitoxin system
MILLDNCMPHRYQRLLQEWGYDVSLLSDHIAADAPDSDVIALATELDAALLTVDLDFSNILDYPPQKDGGIIVMRYKIQDEAEADVSLKTALDELYRDGLCGVLVIVSPRHYRVRSEQD